MRNKTRGRLRGVLALLVTLSMVLGMLPTQAMAEQIGPIDLGVLPAQDVVELNEDSALDVIGSGEDDARGVVELDDGQDWEEAEAIRTVADDVDTMSDDVVAAAESDGVGYVAYTFDVNTNKLTKSNETAVQVAGDSSTTVRTMSQNMAGSKDAGYWFVAGSGYTYNDTVEVSGDVRLIVKDGVTIKCNKGIHLADNATLTIYGQSGSTGRIEATAYEDWAGIGAREDQSGYAGTINIHGVQIVSHGTDFGAGIGGAYNSPGGTVNIYNGIVQTYGDEYEFGKYGGSAGIGTGKNGSGGVINIYGGTVTAQGGKYGAGIGSGDECSGCPKVSIYGGVVNATGGDEAAGIGGGNEVAGGDIYIAGGTVTAAATKYGAGIGGGDKGALGGAVIITGGVVVATGGSEGAGIGGGDEAEDEQGGYVYISDGEVTATGGYLAAGIGGGDDEFGCNVTITGGTVKATGGEQAAGIGGGENARGGSVKLSGNTCTVDAKAGTGDGQAIGKGDDGDSDGTLDLSGAYLKATLRTFGIPVFAYSASQRLAAARSSSVLFEPCGHEEMEETYQSAGSAGHVRPCKYCGLYKGEVAAHTFDAGTGLCTACSYRKDTGKLDQDEVETSKLNATNWMSGISDNRLLCEINMPGTHDASCKEVWSSSNWDAIFDITKPYAITQSRYIPQQLQDGVRLFDYRLTNYYDFVKEISAVNDSEDLFLSHGDHESWYADLVYYGLDVNGNAIKFSEGLKYFRDFLAQNPTETILVAIKSEYSPEGTGGEEDLYRKAATTLKGFAEYKTDDGRDLLYLEDRMPTLEEVRGRIVLLAQNNSLLGKYYYGADKTCGMKWQSEHCGGVSFKIEDHYDEKESEKLQKILEHIGKYVDPLPMDLSDSSRTSGKVYSCIYTSSNAYDSLISPKDIADVVNPAIFSNGDATFKTRGKLYGWVFSDFVTEEMAKTLWLANFPECWRVTYDYGIDGVENKAVKVVKGISGAGVKLPECGVDAPEGQEFAGWMVDNGETVYAPRMSVPISADTVISAVWQEALEEPVVPEGRTVKLALLSDVHYTDPNRIPAVGTAARTHFDRAAAGEIRMMSEVDAILAKALDGAVATQPDAILVSGDLNSNGEYANAQSFSARLREAKSRLADGAGIYVVNGNHDLNMSYAASFEDDGVHEARRIQQEDFRELFSGLGYNGGKRFTYYADTGEGAATKTVCNSGGLSYATQIAEGVTLIALDAGQYSNDASARFDNAQKTAGYINEDLLSWAADQARAAKANGDLVLAMAHHALMPHTPLDNDTIRAYMDSFVAGNWEEVANTLADAGVTAFITGHTHSNDIATHVTPSGSTIYDINTAALCAYPCAWRTLKITISGTGADANYHFDIDSTFIDSIDGIDDLQAHSYIKSGVVEQNMDAMIDTVVRMELLYKIKAFNDPVYGEGLSGYLKQMLNIDSDQGTLGEALTETIKQELQNVDLSVEIDKGITSGTVNIKFNSFGQNGSVAFLDMSYDGFGGGTSKATVNLAALPAAIDGLVSRVEEQNAQADWSGNYSVSALQKDLNALLVSVLKDFGSTRMNLDDPNSTFFTIANEALQAYARGDEQSFVWKGLGISSAAELAQKRREWQQLVAGDAFAKIASEAVNKGVFSIKKDGSYPTLYTLLQDTVLSSGGTKFISTDGNSAVLGILGYDLEDINNGADLIAFMEDYDIKPVSSSTVEPLSKAGVGMLKALTTDNSIANDSKWQFHNVLFDANGGTVYPASDLTVENGMLGRASQDEASLPIPTREGYTFEGWYKDPTEGEPIAVDANFTNVYRIYAHWTFDGTYECVEGRDSTWSKGSASASLFTFVRSAEPETIKSHFAGIMVDGQEVGSENYAVSTDGLVISLNPEYLESLSVGDHVLTALFDDADGVEVAFVIGENTSASAAAFKTQSLTLGGTIGVNFYADLSQLTEEEREGSVVEFTVCGRATRDTFDANHVNSKGYYGFTCPISSVEMADKITAVLSWGDGSSVSTVLSAADYVVKFEKYAPSFDEETRTLVHSLADFGHYVQPFLANARNWTVGVEHAEMFAANVWDGTEADAAEVATEKYSLDCQKPDGSGIRGFNASLVLDSGTDIYLYAECEGGASVESAILGDGTALEVVHDTDGRWRIIVPSIMAHELGRTWDIAIATSTGAMVSVKVSALTWVRSALTYDDWREDKVARDAAASIWHYAKAAEAYKKIHPVA